MCKYSTSSYCIEHVVYYAVKWLKYCRYGIKHISMVSLVEFFNAI